MDDGDDASLPIDILMEILLRVPPNFISKFKRVSKQWNCVISDPSFCQSYNSRHRKFYLPLLGFFNFLFADFSTVQLQFKSNCKASKVFEFKPNGMYNVISASPQGLLLCSHVKTENYCVCNPISDQWFDLPSPPQPCPMGYDVPGISCEECNSDGVVHFKVMLVRRVARLRNHICVQSFSSRTGQWCLSTLTAPSRFSGVWQCTVVADGMFIWNAGDDAMVAYDPNRGDNRLWIIRPPTDQWNGVNPTASMKIGQTPDGHLLFVFGEPLQFRVWELKKKLSSYSLDYHVPFREWSLKHTVNYQWLKLVNYPYLNWKFLPQVVICFKGFHPHNPQLVYLRRNEEVFCYDMERRRLEPIWYEGTPSSFGEIVPYFQPPAHPCLPSMH